MQAHEDRPWAPEHAPAQHPQPAALSYEAATVALLERIAAKTSRTAFWVTFWSVLAIAGFVIWLGILLIAIASVGGGS